MSEVKRKSSGLKTVHRGPLALSVCTRVDKKQGEDQPAKIFRKPHCQTHLKPMILSLKQISGLQSHSSMKISMEQERRQNKKECVLDSKYSAGILAKTEILKGLQISVRVIVLSSFPSVGIFFFFSHMVDELGEGKWSRKDQGECVGRTLLAIQDGELSPVNRNHADLPVLSFFLHRSLQ